MLHAKQKTLAIQTLLVFSLALFLISGMAFTSGHAYAKTTRTAKPASTTYYNAPYWKNHVCGRNAYSFSPDWYMYANGSTYCNTIQIDATVSVGDRNCNFYMLDPHHGDPNGPYAGNTTAYVGVFFGSTSLGVVRVFPNSVNSWVYIGNYDTRAVGNNALYFQVADNNGASSGIIGVSQVQQIC